MATEIDIMQHHYSAASQYDHEEMLRREYEKEQDLDNNENDDRHGYTPVNVPQGQVFVRALYDFQGDDTTSLAFRRGDLIKVLTQLESGWWDGIINSNRGWFPSNYCRLVSDEELAQSLRDDLSGYLLDDESVEDAESDDLDRQDGDSAVDEAFHGFNASGHRHSNSTSGVATTESREDAAFWVPQATADGRLFFYNSLTGATRIDLPLETPSGPDENGPRNRQRVRVPESTLAPAELRHISFDVMQNSNRGSQLSSGESQSASLGESMIENDPNGAFRQISFFPSYGHDMLDAGLDERQKMQFYESPTERPATWNRLYENILRSVHELRAALNNADRQEFVRKAEDISDHLRDILIAGSGTTDNHSGAPSIISANKNLYPHYRDVMSRFSKLVLSTHLAASDWPSSDSYGKCHQEADGVLNGVHSFIEVARSQKGDNIPRLKPGFVLGESVGGSWQNNNVNTGDVEGAESKDALISFMDGSDSYYDGCNEPSARLDSVLLERFEELKRIVVTSIRRLEEHATFTDKVIKPSRHEKIANTICSAAAKVIDYFRPYISMVESIDLANLTAPITEGKNDAVFADFTAHKQKLYDFIGDLLVACQTVSGPLADEWSDNLGENLEARVKEVRTVAKRLEAAVVQTGLTLQVVLDSMPSEAALRLEAERKALLLEEASTPSSSNKNSVDVSSLHDVSKVKKFFGEVPASAIVPIDGATTVQGGSVHPDVPYFLRLDYDNEITYDTKTDPPLLRGGSLVALVEQLTRHDKLDAAFNNTFLLTYRSFTTAPVLFDHLVKRFMIQPPRAITQDDYKVWVEKKQKLIRLRIVNILKSWFEHFWLEPQDETSTDLLRRVSGFAKDSVATTATPGSGALMTAVEMRMKNPGPSTSLIDHDSLSTNGATRRNPSIPSGLAPAPILPKNLKKIKLLDIDSMEFARQITLIEYRLLLKIKATEFLDKTWQRKVNDGDVDPAPNVKAFILHSNQLTNWITEQILSQSDTKKRVLVIKHFVQIAEKCRLINNFSGVTSILSALESAPIYRLQRTWSFLSQKVIVQVAGFKALMLQSKNFSAYREALRTATGPTLPFLGVYLTDLTFIADGIPDMLKRTNTINFAKRAKTAEIIREIQAYQNMPYVLTAVPELQDWISAGMSAAAGDGRELFDKSLLIEPREREDEKIARYVPLSPFKKSNIQRTKPAPTINTTSATLLPSSASISSGSSAAPLSPTAPTEFSMNTYRPSLTESLLRYGVIPNIAESLHTAPAVPTFALQEGVSSFFAEKKDYNQDLVLQYYLANKGKVSLRKASVVSSGSLE